MYMIENLYGDIVYRGLKERVAKKEAKRLLAEFKKLGDNAPGRDPPFMVYRCEAVHCKV